MDQIFEVLSEYINNQYEDIDDRWPDYIFEYRSRQRWAANEIINLILQNPLDNPEDIIENFIYKMLYFGTECRNDDIREMYDIAANVGEELLMLLV